MRAVSTTLLRHRGARRTAERLLASGGNGGGIIRGGGGGGGGGGGIRGGAARGVACEGRLPSHPWPPALSGLGQSHREPPRLPSTPSHHDRHGRYYHSIGSTPPGCHRRRHRHQQWRSQERRFATVAPILSSRLFNVLGLHQFDEKELKAAFEAKGGWGEREAFRRGGMGRGGVGWGEGLWLATYSK